MEDIVNKAKELYDKMDIIHYMKLGGNNKDSKGLPVSMHDDQVKQCALIAINEVIKALEEHQWQNRNTIEDYKQMKLEVEKL